MIFLQPKKPRFNPLILALALAAVLMVWSVLGGGSSSGGSSSMVYSTAVQYFENLQVTKFTLDLNTGVLTMTLKEGKLALPDPSSVSTVQSTGGLLSGMLSSSSSGSTGAEKNSDGTVTVRETWDASEAKIFGFIPAAPVFRTVGAFARNRRNIALSLAKLHRTFEK